MTKRKRIVVTGLGVVSSLGDDVERYYERLLAGESGVTPITNFDVSELSTRFSGSVKDFSAEGYIDRKMARRADPAISYALVAGKKAIKSSGLDLDNLDALDKQRCGILIGSGMGGMKTFYEGVEAYLERGIRKVSPFFVPFIITNMGGAILAMDLGFMGPNYSISTACATGNHCIISAADHIRNGDADLMVCGGVEASGNPAGLIGFIACRALSQRNDEPTRASRPWDKGRDGFVLGEGAGVLVLESLEHAQARGAPIYAEYLGGGISCDAYHMTEPREDGLGVSLCIQSALKKAEISAERINYVNAHATSTPAGDMAEVNAIRSVLPDPSKVTINGTKSMIGHGLGAAAGLEAVATVKAIHTGKVHPTINLEDPEEGIQGFDVPTEAVERDIDVAISNSFGFGGHNSAVLFSKFS